ncbi:MAG: carbohydrate-binding family V/XII, partial [Burkholderiales bacterium]
MRKLSEFLVAAASCLLPLEALGVDPESTDEVAAHSSPWPMQIAADGRTVVVHAPQIESWANNQLQGRAAVSVQVEGAEQPNFGVIRFTASTETDTANQVVSVRDFAIGSADFPAASDRGADYLALLKRHLRSLKWNIALQRLQSDLAIDRAMQQARRQPLRNDPPRIFFTERPAILVPVDGTPVLRALHDSGFMRVVNTRALILFDRTVQRYYLFIAGRWMTAQSLDGTWAVTDSVPAQLQRAKELAIQKDQVELLEADGEQSRFASAAPAVYVSTTPAELLQTDGAPEYAPIENTRLLYVTNSPNKIFLDLVTQQHYALISGRWLRAPRLEQNSWQYVSGAELPADFAMIPPDHPMASVRAAVPGTPQANEAIIANSVPQVASVRRSAASLEITYDGEATLRPIAGTSLQYAVNAPIPVISIGENDYYALDNGVWFAASSPYGPWSVASYVPQVIYSIPRSSPLHYVTYVRVYDATPETVYVGYTPGYVGSYVAGDGVVVYGTGWAYRPWIGSVWYGPPVTWGHGFTVIYSWWNPWWPWGTVGWTQNPCFRPWWG